MQSMFWGFTKRRNSTLRPSDEDSDWHPELNLKGGTSLLSPVFLLGSPESAQTVSSYNYCKAFGNYYYINEWSSVGNDLWQCRCELDELATYRTYIGSATAYVTHESGSNSSLVDSRLPLETERTVTESSGSDLGLSKTGTVLFSCVGETGAVTYAFAYSYLNQVLQSITDWADTIYNAIDADDIAGTLRVSAQQFASNGSASSCIRSAVWVPIIIGDPGAEQEITLGQYHTGIFGRVIKPGFSMTQGFVDIPYQSEDWRRTSPYTEVYFYFPFVGLIHIPSSVLVRSGSAQLTYEMSFDNMTGNIAVAVYSGSLLVGTYGAKTAVDIPVGVSNITPSSVVTGIASAAAGIAALGAGNVAGGLASGFAGINAVMTANNSSVGGIGSFAGYGLGLTPKCWCVIHNPRDFDKVSPVIGVPSFRVKRIGSVNGYVKTLNASVSAPCGAEVLNRINGMLDGGIYYE